MTQTHHADISWGQQNIKTESRPFPNNGNQHEEDTNKPRFDSERMPCLLDDNNSFAGMGSEYDVLRTIISQEYRNSKSDIQWFNDTKSDSNDVNWLNRSIMFGNNIYDVTGSQHKNNEKMYKKDHRDQGENICRNMEILDVNNNTFTDNMDDSGLEIAAGVYSHNSLSRMLKQEEGDLSFYQGTNSSNARTFPNKQSIYPEFTNKKSVGFPELSPDRQTNTISGQLFENEDLLLIGESFQACDMHLNDTSSLSASQQCLDMEISDTESDNFKIVQDIMNYLETNKAELQDQTMNEKHSASQNVTEADQTAPVETKTYIPSSLFPTDVLTDLFPNEENDQENIASIDLGKSGIELLVQALQTQSFTPIITLLHSLLISKSQMDRLLDNMLATDGIISTVPSPEDNSRSLSTQGSFDSGFSDTSASSPYSVNAEMETTVYNEQDNSLKRPGDDIVYSKNNKFSRIDRESTRNSEMLAEETQIDSFIEDMMRPTESCDVETFEKIMNKSDSLFSTEEAAKTAKLFNEASTNTTGLLESTWRYHNSTETYQTSLSTQNQGSETNEQKDNEPAIKKQKKKRGSKHAKLRPGPNKCYHLWDFLRDLLDSDDPSNVGIIHWVDEKNGEFKLTDTKHLAELWGKKKRISNMNYDKLSRSLRYYIKLDILQKIPGKRLHFRFGNGRMWRKIA